MKRIITLIVAACAAFVAHAADDFVNIKLLTGLQATSPEIVSANLTNLSPQAIELGLRDAELLADFSYDEKTRVLDIEWHSISKEVKGTKLSETFSIPLNSKVKLGSDIAGINAGQKMVAVGDGTEIIDAYNRLLAQAQENIDIDNSKKMLNAEDNNNSSGSSGGSSGGSGYLSDSGVGGDSTENAAFEDVEVTTDPVISNVQECPMRVDLAGMVVYEQERTIKTSTETGDVVEATPCEQAGEQYPIRKDFEAGCTVKMNEAGGEYIKGYKLYSFVNGARYDISECEWSQDDAIGYRVQMDFDACSFNTAVIKENEREWLPSFVQFTEVEGKRYDLSQCVTNESVKRDLKVTNERCTPLIDVGKNLAFEQKREVLHAPDGVAVQAIYDCVNTGKEYALLKDLDYQGCSALPNYNESRLYRGFRYYINESGEKTYLSDCTTSLDVYYDLSLELADCEARINLTDGLATLTSKWFYTKENGEKTAATECVETDKTYDLVETEDTCTPQLVPASNKVVIFTRVAWFNDDNLIQPVTDCRASSGEVAITVEYCEEPRYEHDLVGGVSYYRSRDFYMHNGDKYYINGCSRDTRESFPHTQQTAGCGVAHDNGNKRSRMYAKTILTTPKDNELELKGCTPYGSYIPYVLLSAGAASGQLVECFLHSKANQAEAAKKLAATYPGAQFIYDSHPSHGLKTYSTSGCNSYIFSKFSILWSKTQNQWRRFDGSLYNEAIVIRLRKG